MEEKRRVNHNRPRSKWCQSQQWQTDFFTRTPLVISYIYIYINLKKLPMCHFYPNRFYHKVSCLYQIRPPRPFLSVSVLVCVCVCVCACVCEKVWLWSFPPLVVCKHVSPVAFLSLQHSAPTPWPVSVAGIAAYNLHVVLTLFAVHTMQQNNNHIIMFMKVLIISTLIV